MKNIEQYKKRFYSLIESEMGNVKPLISEQPGAVYKGINKVGGFLSNFVDDATKSALSGKFGREAVESFDSFLGRALNTQNLASEGGKNYIKSASGSNKLGQEDLEALLVNLSRGTLDANNAAKFLPERLADGTNFRSEFIKTFNSKNLSNPTQKQIPPGWKGSVEGYYEKMGDGNSGQRYAGSN